MGVMSGKVCGLKCPQSRHWIGKPGYRIPGLRKPA
jgi:hypothetical protein